eukprot:COSAG01_NODE_765_length_13738_cov_21.521870_8_plen_372_part_00
MTLASDGCLPVTARSAPSHLISPTVVAVATQRPARGPGRRLPKFAHCPAAIVLPRAYIRRMRRNPLIVISTVAVVAAFTYLVRSGRRSPPCTARMQADIWPAGVSKPPPRRKWPQWNESQGDGAATADVPLPIAFNWWRTRRRFDADDAKRELCWEPSDGGLNDYDRDILAEIYYLSESVFECGLGESTQIAIYTGIPRLTGADSSLEWVQAVRQTSPAHYRFHWADVGAVLPGKWGVGDDPNGTRPKLPFYSTAVLAAEGAGFDFYLVDGRFRVATFAACLLHAAKWGLNREDFQIGLHDFRARSATSYAAVMPIADIVAGFDPMLEAGPEPEPEPEPDPGPRIAIFRRKIGVTDAHIRAVWEANQLNQD